MFVPEASEWCRRWGVPGLDEQVSVRFSSRVTASLGRCTPAKRSIRLNPALAGGPRAFLLEVVCHELAHVAAYELFGAGIRPHGCEWQGLMRQVGYRPATRLAPPTGLKLARRARRRRQRRYLYVHSCPVCQWSRSARAVVRRWRCPTCREDGGEGGLEVWRYTTG